MQDFFNQLVANLKNTSLLEFIAVIAGIVSVWFSRKENIWVYPTGLINTIIYIYICFTFDLIGEASVNFLLHDNEHLWLAAMGKERRRPSTSSTYHLF